MSGEPPIFLQPPVFMLVFMVVMFYFTIIRPQQKKQKDHESMVSALDKNDEVLTAGGIHATIVAINPKTVTLRIADNVKIEVEKSAITQVTKKRE